jgi:putative flippase GtrA
MLGDTVVRLWRLYQTPLGKRLFRYSMVSVVSTIVSLGTLAIVYGVFRVWTEVPSTLFANLVAVVPSYYLNRNWAWGKSGRSHVTREVLPFWVASVAGILLSILTSSEARDFSLAHHLHHFGSTVIVEGANIFAFGVLWVLKFLVFNRLFHVTPEAELEEELHHEHAQEVGEALAAGGADGSVAS